MKHLYLLLFISAFLNFNFAQDFKISGYVYDSISSEPLHYANVSIKNSDAGSTTNQFGYYELQNLPKTEIEIIVSYVGYETVSTIVNLNERTSINFELIPLPTLLDETIIETSRVKFRETPISYSEINAQEISNRIGSQDAMQILNTLPGVYVSPQGGGTGDLRLNLRGFDQTDIGVMLNGVPVNNPENGEVYWSNYAGIADVLSSIQVQRGLGASPYSTSSIGGLVNIVTTGFSNRTANTKFQVESGSNNFRKVTLAINNPVTENISLTALVSRKLWDGYADQTKLDEFTYYLSAGLISGTQSFVFQLIGSPQTHGQRITPSLISDYEKYGINYNPDWGYLNGDVLQSRDNKFHKPSLNLIHNWLINSSWNLSTVLYYTHGEGGGTVPPFTSFNRTNSGQIDFQNEWISNSNNIDTNYHPSLNRSLNPLRSVVHKHNWLGGVTSINYKEDSFSLTFGADGKYYAAQNYATLGHLLGGDYYIGFANKNRNPKTLLVTGDKVDYDADSFAQEFGGFGQVEYSSENYNTFLNVSVSNISYKRRDNFNYSPNDPNYETDWESFFNYSIKTGFNYKFNPNNNAYVNVGYLTKAPISFNVFDYSNNKYQNVVNEKIFNAELGYGFIDHSFRLNLNTYFTLWKDRAISRTIQDQNTGNYFFYNIIGASARHYGIESDLNFRVNENLFVEGMFSYALNKWTSDVNTVLAPESNPTQRETINSFVNNLYVGNSPMTRFYLSTTYLFELGNLHSISFTPSVTFFGRIYADYDPANRDDVNQKDQNAWRLPDYHLVDFHVNYDWRINSQPIETISVSFHIFNLLNSENIVYALDGPSHSQNSARVFYGQKRNWSMSLTLEL